MTERKISKSGSSITEMDMTTRTKATEPRPATDSDEFTAVVSGVADKRDRLSESPVRGWLYRLSLYHSSTFTTVHLTKIIVCTREGWSMVSNSVNYLAWSLNARKLKRLEQTRDGIHGI